MTRLRALRHALLFVLLLTAHTLRADTPSWATTPLSLHDCIERALRDAPTVQRLQARVLAAEALLQQARTLPNPHVAYTAQDIGLQTSAGPALLHQSLLSYPVLISYLRTQEARVARAGIAQAHAQSDEDRRQLRLAIGRAYFAALLSDRWAALEADAAALAADIVAQTQRRLQHGDIGTYDVERARAEELDARRSAEQASRRRDLDHLSLSIAIGADEPFLVPLRDRLVDLAIPFTGDHSIEPDALLARARTARPDLRAARATLQRATEQGRLEARRAFPLAELQLIGGVRIADPGVGGLLAFGAPLPLFDHNDGPRTAAAAQILSARSALTLLERQAAVEVLSAERDHRGASDALLRFVRPQVALRETALRGARRLLAEGMAPLLDVVAAQRDLLASRRALAQAEHDVALAVFRLGIALGEQ